MTSLSWAMVEYGTTIDSSEFVRAFTFVLANSATKSFQDNLVFVVFWPRALSSGLWAIDKVADCRLSDWLVVISFIVPMMGVNFRTFAYLKDTWFIQWSLGIFYGNLLWTRCCVKYDRFVLRSYLRSCATGYIVFVGGTILEWNVAFINCDSSLFRYLLR